MGFLEASAHGRSGLRTVVAYFAGGSLASDLTFLHFGELHTEGKRKGGISLHSSPKLSPCGCGVIKGRGSHRGEAQRPSVLSQMCWVQEAVGRQGREDGGQEKRGHVEGRARAGHCAIKGAGWGGAGWG